MREVGEFRICGSVPPFLLDALQRYAAAHAVAPADVRIGRPPLLSRWRMLAIDEAEVKLHVFHRSDDDRAKHDHPWDSLSITLRAGAIDVSQGGRRTPMLPGMMIYRSADYAHWIEVVDGHEPMTLFVTGPKVREWGFLCPQGWRHWKDFTAPFAGAPSGAVGAGCD